MVIGGETRQQSVYNALKALKTVQPHNVLIHDAARPQVSELLVYRVIAALQRNSAVDVSLAINDSVKSVVNNKQRSIDRKQLYLSQTPQGFLYSKLLSLHEEITETKKIFSDDISIYISNNIQYATISGENSNYKITTQDDLKLFKASKIAMKQNRVGCGTDIHKFSLPLEHDIDIVLGGVKIRHNQAIIAHSDGDVILHALTDAILGSLALGDIGQIFPMSKKCFKDMASSNFLLYAQEQVSQKNAKIINIDLTVICEKPKISPHYLAIRQKIAELLEIDFTQISVKATTSEGLGFTGRQEGVMVQAFCNILI